MNEGPITEATLQASLRDIRLPSEAAGGPLAEALMVLAVAGIAALLLAGLWRLASRGRARTPRWQDGLAALPQDEALRRTALLHLLKHHAPERFAALKPRLYTPDAPDAATLEAELRRHA